MILREMNGEVHGNRTFLYTGNREGAGHDLKGDLLLGCVRLFLYRRTG